MARAVATNFYTPKELTFQGGIDVFAGVPRATAPNWSHIILSYRRFPHERDARAHIYPGRIHEGTVPFVKLSGWSMFPVTISECSAESLWRWF
jgi:hypothetical protein